MLRRSVSIRLLVCTLLGLLTTVAVAWSVALADVRPSPSAWSDRVQFENGSFMVRRRVRGVGRVIGTYEPMNLIRSTATPNGVVVTHQNPNEWPAVSKDWGLSAREMQRLVGNSPVPHQDHGFGLPLPALWWSVIPSTPLRFVGESDVGVLAGHPPGKRVLPFRPIWPGLIGNTFMFAAVWFGVMALMNRHVARRRIRRGLCARCAYELRGIEGPCPECGGPRGETARSGNEGSERSGRHWLVAPPDVQ